MMYPIKPQRVYNPATARFDPPYETWPGVYDKNPRFTHWRRNYNRSGAEIITLEKIDGLKNNRTFDMQRGIDEFGKSFFMSTLSYMFAEAMWENYEQINMIGIGLNEDDNHFFQIPCVLRAILECENRGMTINVKPRRRAYWEWAYDTTDWSKVYKPEWYLHDVNSIWEMQRQMEATVVWT